MPWSKVLVESFSQKLVLIVNIFDILSLKLYFYVPFLLNL